MTEKHYISYGQYPRKGVPRMAVSRRSFAGIASIVLILGALLLVAPAATASPNPVPVVQIKLDTSNQIAKVSESAQGTVQFSGTVSIDKLPVERVVVTLTTSVDAGWASQCSPSSMLFTSTAPQSFTVTVIVPQATPSNIIGTLKIDGKAVGGGLQGLTNTQAIITVAPYYRVMMESDMPYREITPGSQAFYSFKIWNVGNAIDSFELEIVNLKDLVQKKWTVTLSSNQIAKVNPNEYKTVRVTCQSPRDWVIWKSEPTMINIKSSSMNAKEGQLVITQSFPLYAYEKGMYIPGFDPLFLIVAIAFGAIMLQRRKE